MIQDDEDAGGAPPPEDDAGVDDEDDTANPFEDLSEGGNKGANGKDQDASWKADLPTEAMAAANPLQVLEPRYIRALARFFIEDEPAYYRLLIAMAMAAAVTKMAGYDLITRAKLDAKVQAEVSRMQSEAEKVEDKEEKDNKSPAKILMQLVEAQQFQLFSDKKGRVAYADFPRNGHVETARIHSEDLQQWLEFLYFAHTGSVLPLEALNSVIRTLAATARYKSPRREVDLRTMAYIDENGDRVLLIDLGDDTWQYIKITRHGWQVCQRTPTNADLSGMNGAPVRMHRSDHMLPLPEPTRGGDLRELAPFLGVKRSDALKSSTFIMGVAWALIAITPWGVYLHLLIDGGPGTLKTSTGQALGGLLDPHSLPEREFPATPQELAIAARHSLVLMFDNLMEAIARAMLSAVCKASTGGGHAARTLYSNDGETVLNFKRPLILTSTTEQAAATELAARALQIQKDKYVGKFIPPDVIEAVWVRELPGILGALYDVVVGGMTQEAVRTGGIDDNADIYSGIRLKDEDLDAPAGASAAAVAAAAAAADRQRMQGAVRWLKDCEAALGWPPETFQRFYQDSLQLGAEQVAGADPVITALRAFMEEQPETATGSGVRTWKGSATDLLKELEARAGAQATRTKGWPKLPRALSQRLFGEQRTTLGQLGFTFVRPEVSHKHRSIEVTYTESGDEFPGKDENFAPFAPPDEVVSQQEQEMQSGTAENEEPLRGAKKRRTGGVNEAQRGSPPETGDYPNSGGASETRQSSPPRRPNSAPPRKNGGKPPVSEGKKPKGAQGAQKSQLSGESGFRAVCPTDPAPAPKTETATTSTPQPQPPVEEPSEKPIRRRIRITPESAP